MWFFRLILAYTFFVFFIFLFCLYRFFISFFFVFYSRRVLFDFYIFRSVGLDFSFSFVFDFISLGFFSRVSFISFIVFLYRGFYIDGTVDSRRFYWLVFLFVLSMFFLVFSGNFILTMVGWDGLGLVSFCLVIFYSNSSSLESGLITVFSNRIGDVFFLISFIFFFICGNLSFEVISFDFFFVFCFLVFTGAITKSAQVPFSAWLPAAIAAPTPVSSLVHSSTLVTAGVYILVRFNYFFSFLNFMALKTFFILTIVLAGLCSIVEGDLKKIVAMSTLSQLGIMMFILSVGAWLLTFIHIIIHAFFKRMLFLRTGSLMGQIAGGQDSRFYGGKTFCYNSFIFFSVSCLCLAGFPFFLGFYSKDFIISSCSLNEGFFFFYIFLLGCTFTVIYSFRLIFNGYSVMYKYSSHIILSENLKFFFPVTFLFLKCWLTGGFFYWIFLSDLVIFFFLIDLFTGLILFFSGLTLFFFVKFFYSFFFDLASIFFIRWMFSGGTSFFFRKISFLKYERTWMELLGGSGVYTFLLGGRFLMKIFYGISTGAFVFWVLVITIYIY